MHHLSFWRFFSAPWVIFISTIFSLFVYTSIFSNSDTSFITQGYLLRLISNTLILCFLTSFIATLIAVPLAILTSIFEFPGHKFFTWALSLSLAFPAYIYAFIYVGVFEYSSPIAQLLLSLGIGIPSIKNVFGGAFVLALALFPYIFLLTKAQIKVSGIYIFKAAKSMGLKNSDAVIKVIIPSIKTSIIAGIILIVLETIADFGGVSTLRIDTFTVGIYDAWFGYQDYVTAAKLSIFLLILALFIMQLSNRFGGDQEVSANADAQEFEKIALAQSKRWLASFFCALVFFISFLFPFIQILIWAFENNSSIVIDNFDVAFNSIFISLIVALFISILAIILVLTKISLQTNKWLIDYSVIGYAIPGSVISVGLMVSFNIIFNIPITTLGLIGLFLGLSIRFMTPAFRYIEAATKNIPKNSQIALSGFSFSPLKGLKKFYIPSMAAAIKLSFLVVFIEVMKEQPATLLLRPVGFDTLSSKIYNYTSEGQWILASSPSLILIITCLISVYLINKGIDSSNN